MGADMDGTVPDEDNRRFELRSLAPMKWAVLDRMLPDDDPHRMVACVYEVDEFECDVFWFRELHLPLRYATPGDVLAAVVRASSTAVRAPHQRPVPIPVVRMPDRMSA